MSVSFHPTNLLKSNTYYCGYAYGVYDLAGNAAYAATCFYTGLGSDTTPPVISAMSPPSGGATAINVTLQFYASKAISPITFNANTAVTLATTNGNVAVAGTATLKPDLVTITFKPTANLASNTAYTVKVSGFADLAGNTLAPFTGTFTTNNTGLPDTVQPIVLSTLPANNATGVATNSTITLNYSKPINPQSVNASSFYVFLQTSGLVVAGSYSVVNTASDSTVTFTPAAPVPSGSTVFVYASYYASIQDLVGNNSQSFTSYSFKTAATVDSTAPTVTSVTPSDQSSSVGLNTIVSITFSKSISPTTVTNNNFGLFAGATRLGIGLAYSADYRTVTLSPNQLPPNSTIQVTIGSGVLDLSGNALAPFQSQFTTVPFADATRPYVTGQRPGNGATQVPLDSPVTLFLSKAMDQASTTSSIKLSQNGVLLAGTAVLSGKGQILTFTPSNPLSQGALLQVFLNSSALDTFGNQATNYVGSFSTPPDLTAKAPVVTATIPAGAGNPLTPVIEIQFSKPLDATTVTGNVGLFFQQNNQSVPVTLSLRGDRTIRMIPVQPLNPTFGYYYQANTSVKDTTGLALANTQTFYFQTGTVTDTTQPSVVTITPPNGATAVGVNAPVTLHFSKPLNALTVSTGAAGTIQLTANGNPVAPSSISFGSTQDVTITPYGTFPDNTVITVTATAGLQDPSGNALIVNSNSTATFTTLTGADVTTANVLAMAPAANATNVPLNTIIELTTDDVMDINTINISSLQLYDNNAGNPLPGTYALSPSGKVITFVPAANLTASHTYRYYWNYLMHNISGNSLNGGSSAFTASSSVVNTPPTVIATNPPDGYTQVPTNLSVQILFSAAVNPATIGAITVSTGGNPLNMTPVLGNGNQTLTLIPPSLLKPNTAYTITITGVSDVAGNVLASTVTVNFTTGAGTVLAAPAVVLATPAAGTTGVSKSAAGVLVLNKPLNRLSLAGNFYIYQQNTGVPVPGTATLSADGMTATYTPTAPLLANTAYQLYIVTATDIAGNVITSSNTTFTTGP
ncbi:MAG: Ig-like domain-containing protein [Terriglobia bacterium]